MLNQQKKIDTHHHFIPHFFAETLHKKGIHKIAGAPLPLWTPETSLEVMEEHQIETAILSLSAPGVYFGNVDEACYLARECNEYAATLTLKYPGHFGSFAVLPMPFTDQACKEAIYALDTLRADGIVLLGSTEGIFLGDSSLDELMNELNRRNAVVFIHPNLHASSESLNLKIPGFFIEFLCDTTRAAVNLMISGTLEKYVNIRWILAHAGGFLPYIAWRISLGNLLSDVSEHAPQGFLHYIQKFYYDTALSPSPYVLSTLQKLIEPSYILFGSDFPFAPSPITSLQIQSLAEQKELSEDTRFAIYRNNALQLFPHHRNNSEIIKKYPEKKSSSFITQQLKIGLKRIVISMIEHVRNS